MYNTVWTVNDVLVDPYPFYCIKRARIDQNRKGYGSTRTSLTVLAVYSKFMPPSVFSVKLTLPEYTNIRPFS